MRLFIGALIAFFFVAVGVAPVHAERRRALVVGIDDYENVPKLQKAVGDARALDTALKGAGFEVDLILNPDRRNLNTGISAFFSKIQQGDTALIHFSGHGMQIDAENYLLATDAPDAEMVDKHGMRSEAIPLQSILDRLKDTQSRTRIVLVDACRNNPFAERGTRSIGAARGLAAVVPPEGTFIMFSAGVGQAARDRLSDDDQEPTSVFTRTLLRKISVEGKPITDIAREVRDDVGKLVRDQRPAYYDELSGGQFYFVPPASNPQQSSPSSTSRIETPRDERPIDGLSVTEAFAIAKSIGTPGAWDAFVKRYPSGFHADMAREERTKLARQERDAHRQAERKETSPKADAPPQFTPPSVQQPPPQRQAVLTMPSAPEPAPPARDPDRATASSQAGWTLGYDSDLLYVSSSANDHFDATKRSYNTIWHSKRHGEEVAIYVQVSPNEQCRPAPLYAKHVIAPRRGQVERTREIRDSSGQRQSVIMEARGFLAGRKLVDKATIDFVSHRRGDPSTIVHVGGRFPPEWRDLYRAEVLRMLDSMTLPFSGPFARSCA